MPASAKDLWTSSLVSHEISLTSALHTTDYQEHFFNPISYQSNEDDVNRYFMFCECATKRVKIFTCDGEQRIEENNCVNWDSSKYQLSRDHTVLHGIRAVRYLRSRPGRQQLPRGLLTKLLKPAEEKFEHCESRLYGTNPDTVVQKGVGLTQNLYFKRCNGLYVNSLGQMLAEPSIDLSSNNPTTILVERLRKATYFKRFLDPQAWKIPANVSSCQARKNSYQSLMQAALEKLEASVRRGNTSMESLIKTAYVCNG